MLKILSNLFKKKIESVDDILEFPEGRRYYRESHPLRKNQIDEDALKIIHRLNKFGYKGYVVGGGVRDLLLERKPKDFDVVTNATPNQIKKIFNNCRIIGRRFKIVHVIFKGKIIEVSTFRSLPSHRLEPSSSENDYLLKRDNEFGSPKEDSARRDFTINALYYDPRNDSIIDFVGGFEDIQNRVLRVIGDPDISFKEDPVRMLRAVKFSVLLGLELDKETKKAIRKNKAEIEKASSSRMLEEYNKIFRTWKTSLIFKGLAENHLLEVLFKEAVEKAKKADLDWGENFLETKVGKRLVVADKLLSEREEMTPHIFYSILFSDLVEEAILSENMNMVPAIKSALDPIFERLTMPKKDKDRIIKIFASQHRFLNTEDERASQNNFFRKKDFFYDAFMVFKIGAIAENRDEDLQSAFFWEISVRKRPAPPTSHKKQNRSKGGRPRKRPQKPEKNTPTEKGRPDLSDRPDRSERTERTERSESQQRPPRRRNSPRKGNKGGGNPKPEPGGDS